MEATEEQPGLLHHILPPRIEDAGLEDCALPPDSITEAFLRAANAVKSRATSIFTSDDDEEDCINDPRGKGELMRWSELLELAAERKAELWRLVGGEEEKRDELIDGGEGVGGDKACVDGLVGLEIGDKKKKKKKKKNEGPILVGGYA